MKIGKEETMWVAVDKKAFMYKHTLSYLRKDAITALIDGSSMTWNECQSYGWRIKKVKVLITEIE